MGDYVKLVDYKNIRIPKEHTIISDSDIENIMSWDFTTSDSYIKEINRNNIVVGDIVFLTLSYSNNMEKETLELYYEIGSNDIFENDDLLIGKKVGTGLITDAIIYEEIVSANVEVGGIFRHPNLSDEEFILSYYNCSSLNEVKQFIRERAYNEIVYHYMWNYILENSEIITIPPHINKKINSLANDESNWEEAYSYYVEFMVAQTILEKEKLQITDSDIHNIIISKCQKLQIDINDIYTYYNYDDLYFEALMQTIRDFLVPLIITE